MIRVTALTSGRNVPSSRFRVRQHIEPLRLKGFDVHEHYPAIDKYAAVPGWPFRANVRWAPHFLPWQGLKLAARVPGIARSWRSDITWLEREMLSGRYSLERLIRGTMAFDVDDAIWLLSPAAAAAAAAIARRADVVIAGNAFLADWFSGHAADVRVIPTAIDTARFRPGPSGDHDRFVIGWTGSSSTLPYLEAIEAPLAAFLKENPRAELLVMADRPPKFVQLDPGRVRFLVWTADREAEALRNIDIGIMPLPDDDWSRGKCSFKMLQYMSCGVPVVVSPVGMNTEVLARGEVGLAARGDRDWLEALRTLAANPGEGRRMGTEGRRVIEKTFSVEVVSAQIACVFEELAKQAVHTNAATR